MSALKAFIKPFEVHTTKKSKNKRLHEIHFHKKIRNTWNKNSLSSYKSKGEALDPRSLSFACLGIINVIKLLMGSHGVHPLLFFLLRVGVGVGEG